MGAYFFLIVSKIDNPIDFLSYSSCIQRKTVLTILIRRESRSLLPIHRECTCSASLYAHRSRSCNSVYRPDLLNSSSYTYILPRVQNSTFDLDRGKCGRIRVKGRGWEEDYAVVVLQRCRRRQKETLVRCRNGFLLSDGARFRRRARGRIYNTFNIILSIIFILVETT